MGGAAKEGMLVAFEGIDGSGVSTHSRLAAERLSMLGYRAFLWKEPTRGPIGQLIREFLALGGADGDIMALLFAADRLWGLRHARCRGMSVEDRLREGYIVIFDRYKYSSLAYQGYLTGDMGWVETVNSRSPEADVIIFLDVDLRIVEGRLRLRGLRESYERMEILRGVREAYERVLEHARTKGVEVVVVRGDSGGAERPVEEVSREIVDAILEAASKRGLKPCHRS